MYTRIQELIYTTDMDELSANERELIQKKIGELARKAFVEKDEESLLIAHRILYVLNMARLSVAWEYPAKNNSHPFIVAIKYELETRWEKADRQQSECVLQTLPTITSFSSWIKNQVQQHACYELHPIFMFLRDKATFEQMREFSFQETPLEMLFGDIIAMMLPGVYGPIKIEFLKNYWDEVGHAQEENIHRNLRADLMKRIGIPKDCHLIQMEWFIREELELINLYLSLGTDRPKHTQLAGVLFATELMIPNRFQYLIDGWKRLGLEEGTLTYLIEHTTLDQAHSEDWLNHVIMPILKQQSSAMTEIVFGVFRRLNAAVAVLDKLYIKLQKENMSLALEKANG